MINLFHRRVIELERTIQRIENHLKLLYETFFSCFVLLTMSIFLLLTMIKIFRVKFQTFKFSYNSTNI